MTTDQDDVAINGDLTRYRVLLKISGTVGWQPTVDAVLHSLAALLSNVVAFDHMALLLSDSSGSIGGATERLGLKRTTLQNKMRRLGIGKVDDQSTVEKVFFALSPCLHNPWTWAV